VVVVTSKSQLNAPREAAGTVRQAGPGVTEFAVGDRVAWVYAYGTYAEQIAVPAASAVPVPDEIPDEVAAAVMMQGLTAHHFVTEAYLVSAGGQFTGDVLGRTGGEGVHVVYDGGGQATFRASMQVLRRHGTLLYYGAFIGEVPVVSMRDLPNRIKVCYPVFRDHIPTRAALLAHSAELFGLISRGALQVRIGGRYPLEQAGQAHADIESRRTTGKLLLLP